MKQSTAKLKCNCDHSYQDRKYGKGVRLHNAKTEVVNGNVRKSGYRCTVCGDEKRTN